MILGNSNSSHVDAQGAFNRPLVFTGGQGIPEGGRAVRSPTMPQIGRSSRYHWYLQDTGGRGRSTATGTYIWEGVHRPLVYINGQGWGYRRGGGVNRPLVTIYRLEWGYRREGSVHRQLQLPTGCIGGYRREGAVRSPTMPQIRRSSRYHRYLHEHGNDFVFYSAVGPDSLIAIVWH